MTRRRGDRWRWSWELDDDPLNELATWDGADTLFAQLRAGIGASAALVASSDDDSIVFTGTNLNASTALLQWTIPASVTRNIPRGNYQLEVQVDIDGEPATIFSEQLTVLDDTAVSS